MGAMARFTSAPRCQEWAAAKVESSSMLLQEVQLPKGSLTGNFEEAEVNPSQLRWDPLPKATYATNFVSGLKTICGAGRYILIFSCTLAAPISGIG